MRKIKEVLRLKFEADLSHERIAAATGVSKGAVTKYVQRAARPSLAGRCRRKWTTRELEALLFPHAAAAGDHATPRPTLRYLHQELKRKGVTLQLLWEEYSAAHPGRAYRYSQFCLLLSCASSGTPQALHAPGAPRRRQAVHRLLRRHRCRSSMAPPARSAVPRSSWRCWARRAMSMPRRRGASSCPTGSPPTCAASNSWAVLPLCSSQTI